MLSNLKNERASPVENSIAGMKHPKALLERHNNFFAGYFGHQLYGADDIHEFTAWGGGLRGLFPDTPEEIGPHCVMRTFENFFLQEEMKSQFISLLSAPDGKRDFPFTINYMDLKKFAPKLADAIEDDVMTLNNLLPEVIINVQKNYLEKIDKRFRAGKNADRYDGDVPFIDPATLSIKGDLHHEAEKTNFSEFDSDETLTTTRVHPRFTKLPLRLHKDSISDMKAKDVDRLIQVVGVVTRAHVIKSLEYKRYLKCKMKTCNKCFSVSANFETEGYEIGVEGLLCDRQKSNKANDVCGNNKFDVIHKDFCDFQEVKIQESSSTLRTGAIPRSLTLILTHDMCNKVNPGDEVRATGVLISRWSPPNDEIRPDITTSLRTLSIEVTNSSHSLALWQGANSNMKDELKERFGNFWKKRVSGGEKGNEFQRRNFILRAVCPRLCGLEYSKLGLLCAIIGGVEEDEPGDRDNIANLSQTAPAIAPDPLAPPPGATFQPVWAISKNTSTQQSGTQFTTQLSPLEATPSDHGVKSPEKKKNKIRSQCHILMVGDPGTGKSQLLKFAQTLVPRSVMTTGVGTTTAGLTCSAVRDGGKGSKADWTLEAGALVLADRGICCIDEFGHMHKEDQVAMLEAMESQTISVNKAGIHTQLTARTTVLASTNPKGQEYNQDKTLVENTGIDPPLLSRFDLIFCMSDGSDRERDEAVTDHLLCSYIKGDATFTGKRHPKKDNTSVREEPTDHVFGKAWDIETLKGYIATVKDNFKPTTFSDDAKEILTEHYIAVRAKDENPVTLRFLQSLKRLAQAHARLMYRNEVTLDDAVAVILLMESTVNEVSYSRGGGSDISFSGNPLTGGLTELGYYSGEKISKVDQKPIQSPDYRFNFLKTKVLKKYMPHLLNNGNGDQNDTQGYTYTYKYDTQIQGNDNASVPFTDFTFTTIAPSQNIIRNPPIEHQQEEDSASYGDSIMHSATSYTLPSTVESSIASQASTLNDAPQAPPGNTPALECLPENTPPPPPTVATLKSTKDILMEKAAAKRRADIEEPNGEGLTQETINTKKKKKTKRRKSRAPQIRRE